VCGTASAYSGPVSSVAACWSSRLNAAVAVPVLAVLWSTRCKGSTIANLKELWPRSGRDVAIRVLFVFDPWSQAVLLVAGNKAGDWSRWYKAVIPIAEIAYESWLAVERKRREES
jgi:hypothetical protein